MIPSDELYARLRSIPHAPERCERDLTLIERQIWQLSQGMPPTFAVLTVAKSLEGRLDHAAFDEALTLVQRRHDAMWTRFVLRVGVPVAQLDPDLRAPLRIVDATCAEDARRLLVAERASGFDLSVGPLFRYLLIRLGPEQHHFVFLAHHISCDFAGLVRVSAELTTAYEALCAGEAPILRPIRVHNRDLSAWQKSWYRGDVRADYEAFWQSQRCDVVAPTLRAMREPTERRGSTLGVTSIELPATTCSALAAYSVAHERSVATVLFGALAMLLYDEGATEGVVIGLFSANRRKETIGIVGNLAVMLPVRIDVAPQLSCGEVFERAHAALSNALRHQDAPPFASEAHGPYVEPYRVLFNCFMIRARELFEVDGCRASGLPVPARARTRYDLEFHATTFQDHSIRVRLDYNAEAIAPGLAADVLQRYANLVERSVTAPARTLRETL